MNLSMVTTGKRVCLRRKPTQRKVELRDREAAGMMKMLGMLNPATPEAGIIGARIFPFSPR